VSPLARALAVTTAILYPVGEGQPRRSPLVTVWSLWGSGIMVYYLTLALIWGIPLIAAVLIIGLSLLTGWHPG
jgi:hypothetical protein